MNTEKSGALQKLAFLCGWSEEESDGLVRSIDANIFESENAVELRNKILDYQYNQEHKRKTLFLYFDWNSAIEDFIWAAEKALQENFDLQLTIPVGNFDPEEQSIYEDGFQESVNTFLKTHGLQLSYLDSPGDDYCFVVHKVVDKEDMWSCLTNLFGWQVSDVV